VAIVAERSALAGSILDLHDKGRQAKNTIVAAVGDVTGYDANMISVPSSELAFVLKQGERLVACVAADGFHASKHSPASPNPHVAVTDQRIALLSRKGMMKKRFDEEVSWPLNSFTERINSNQGTALGPFLYCVSLFTKDDETVTTCFKRPDDREEFKRMAVTALGPVLG
jgi:hypothetical protein